MAVFVPYTAPGDKVEARLTERKERFARAELVRILEPGAGRTEPPCRYHFKLRTEREGRG